jgi:selenocysteine-specific translation elongation factor
MERYKNAKIYKIVDNTNGNVYVGSTCEPTLALRLAKHRSKYKNYLKVGSGFVTSFKILENNDYSIVLLEEYPCETKDQLLARERFYIENNKCINKVVPTRSKNEYYEENKDKLKEQSKEYYEENKDKLKEQSKAYYKENKDKLKEYREKNKDKTKGYQKDYQKDYQEQYKHKLKDYQEEYYKQNKDKLSKILCLCCNTEVFKIKRHEKTEKHLTNLNKETE